MDTTTSPNKRQSSHAAAAYAYLFKRRPSARKIQKRNSLPTKASDQEPVSLTGSAAVRPAAASVKGDRSHRQSQTSQNGNGNEAEAPDPNFRTL
ncbi:hypothetical protein Hte_004510 [Hypoxylon texense]